MKRVIVKSLEVNDAFYESREYIIGKEFLTEGTYYTFVNEQDAEAMAKYYEEAFDDIFEKSMLSIRAGLYFLRGAVVQPVE